MTKLLQQALDALIESRDDVDLCYAGVKAARLSFRQERQLGFYEEQLVKHDAAIEGLKQALAQQEPNPWSEAVTDQENEKFSMDVSTFSGADPEATKYALEQFLRNRAKEQPAQEPFGYVQEASWGLHQSEMVQKITRLRQPDYGFVQALYAHHAPTQPALSDAEVTAKGQVAFGSAWNVIGAYYHKGFRDGEAHCRGGK